MLREAQRYSEKQPCAKCNSFVGVEMCTVSGGIDREGDAATTRPEAIIQKLFMTGILFSAVCSN